MTDLSKVENSATDIFIKILPTITELKNSPIDEEEKLEMAMNLIIKSLCRSRNNCENLTKTISQNYILQCRMNIAKQSDIDGIIRYITNAINKGKNYGGN